MLLARPDGAEAVVLPPLGVAEAGECDRTIVAAWGRSSEHDTVAVARTLFDPFFLRPLGMEETHVSALRAQAWRSAGGDPAAAKDAAARRAAAAARNPRALHSGGRRTAAAWPLTLQDMPLFGDAVAAMVLSARPAGVRLAGLGQSSEPYWPGDRSMTEATALRQADA
jgi:acetyl-CoA C-acetyltransferase